MLHALRVQVPRIGIAATTAVKSSLCAGGHRAKRARPNAQQRRLCATQQINHAVSFSPLAARESPHRP
jgi:hypothetical protein